MLARAVPQEPAFADYERESETEGWIAHPEDIKALPGFFAGEGPCAVVMSPEAAHEQCCSILQNPRTRLPSL